MQPIVNISGYKFVAINQVLTLKERLQQHCRAIGLKGTILLSAEGININLAGMRHQITKFKTYLEKFPDLADIWLKESYSDYPPFRRMLVRIKKEIIAFGHPKQDVRHNEQHTLTPQQLKQWLDEGRDFTLLDTRNDYEVRIGSFSKAEFLPIENFREFPEALYELQQRQTQEQPIVMFCTGGVRCDKALPWMLEHGFDNVYQLHGGIINYFEQCGGAHYQGECFVFDDRIAIDPELKETATVLCTVCQMPVTTAEQQSNHYQKDAYCPCCKVD